MTIKVDDLVKVATNDEMNTRGLHSRYGHVVELITPTVSEICKNCGQRKDVHVTPHAIAAPVGHALYCFQHGNQQFEPLETEQVAIVRFNDFQTHIEVKYLIVQPDREPA